jgi:stage II sporulation protein D
MHSIIKRMICLTVAFVAVFVSFAAADTLSSVSVTAAALSSDQPTLDGMVRVYLSSLGSPTSLTLTVSGSYSLSDGTSLTTGETLYVSFNSSTGAISLTRNGTSYSMGTAFTLCRHSTTGSNGILIAEARKPGNLYPGDIQFKAVSLSGSGYKLYTIAHVYIENYLYGVVPYEMGSSAPLEALKAQAVAARTYTVRMMSARSSWSYDVVDTTGDQTYNGTPTTTTSCNTAVDSTKGILLKYGSAYTATYYSSSNGGQTESISNAWGTSGYSYLGVKDDPFDYANPASSVYTATVYADATSSSNNASLISLLKTKAVSALSSAGYNATASNTTVKTIQDIAVNTPMYATPSRLYSKADFTLTVSTYNTSNSLISVTTTVTCDIFDELESMLGMSLQSLDNELWTVVDNGSSFTLQARRYGHGIGMSQRGAIYMGQLGYTYDEILGFYYDGSSRVACTFTNTILAAGSSEEITTTETPAETDDSTVRGTVSLASGSQLALRSAKSTSATVLTVLSNGTSVTVLSNDGTWCLVKFGSITGYVATSSLTISGTAPESDDSAVTAVAGFAVVTASGYLNLRESGSYSASVLSTAPSGAILTVLSWGETWSQIQYGTVVAYAASAYLTFSSEYPETIDETETDDTADGEDASGNTDTSDSTTLTATVTTESGSLNMRLLAQAGSAILTTIPKGATVTVTSRGETWSAVTYLGTEGYVMTAFLSFTEEETDDTDDTSAVSATSAIVTTTSGSLNLRALPQAGSTIYGTIPQMTVIDVLSQGSTWCQVTYNGITGYVMTAFLTFVEESDTDDTDDTEDTDTDGDTEEEVITAVVTTESGSLNLRSEALSGSKVLARIPQGETLVILQKMTTWSYTSYQGVYGYVLNAFLTFSTTVDTSTSSDTSVTATVTTSSGSLNLRDEPYGNVLTQIPQNATVAVYKRGTAWCYLCYNSVYGYAMTAYLTFDTAADTAADEDTEDTTTATTTTTTTTATSATVTAGTGSRSIFTAKSETADVLITIPEGTVVTLLVQGTSWCKVQYGAYQGYVQTQYLTITTDDTADETEESDPDEDTDTQEDASAAATEETYSVTAWVNTSSGSLNLRASASSTAGILAQIPQYAEVEVLSDIGETWCEISYDDDTGYVMSAYLTTTDPYADSDTEETETTSDSDTSGDADSDTDLPMDTTLHTLDQETIVYVRPPAGSSTLGLYEACSESSELLQNMAADSEVEIVRAGDTWCEVIYNDQLGYCLRDGLSFFED